MKITAALKVGILTLVAILILIVGIGWLKGRSISNGQVLDLQFYDVDGLRVGAPVQMMGYRIGQVESLTPVFDSKQNYVSIKAVITQAGIKIPKASLISIQQSGIIGEKFVEITPPQVKMAYIPKIDNSSPKINTRKRVRVFLDGQYEDIGKVVSVKVIDVRALAKLHQKEFSTPYAYEVAYMITKTGILIPDEVSAKISESNDLVLLPLNNEIVRYYSSNEDYTIVEPMRISEFLDVQLKAAKAFNEINNKINTLLSDDVIDDTQVTLANIKSVSISAADAVAKADELINNSKGDIEQTIVLAHQLTKEVTDLTVNLNAIVSDQEFKSSISNTASSIQSTSNTLNTILQDQDTVDTLRYLRETSKNLSELSASVNDIAGDSQFKTELKSSAANLNKSLNSLDCALRSVSNISPEDKKNIQCTLQETVALTHNLRKFSEKLNKRFLLFRLMF